MDFEKIIDKSLADTTEELGENPRFSFSPECEKECVKPHIILRTYSENLLKNYHSELIQLLKQRGIDI